MWLGVYEASTPGVDGAHNPTVILGDDKEPQPDLALRLLTEDGGQSYLDVNDYLVGAPELGIEVAHSTEAIDMHEKRRDYKAAGVLEYLVVCAKEQQLHWFSFQTGRKFEPDAQGIYRSRVFPGLWLDGQALLARNGKRLLPVLQQGLDSPEHAAFVKELEARRQRGTKRRS
jgi:hypothetical protein